MFIMVMCRHYCFGTYNAFQETLETKLDLCVTSHVCTCTGHTPTYMLHTFDSFMLLSCCSPESDPEVSPVKD